MERYDRLKEAAASVGCKVLEQVPMSQYTTFKIGGPADLFVEIPRTSALCEVLRVCREEGLPYFTLGNGSNLLVPDEGLRGVVFHLTGDFDKIRVKEDCVIECGASSSLMRLCRFAQEQKLSGLEFAWGIPGSVGGAAYMNAGAYQGEMKDVLLSCRHVGEDGILGSRSGADLDLSYRHSAYSGTKDIITFVSVHLVKDDPKLIRERMDDYMLRRKTKQPLEYPSAGSVFKRPEGYYAGGLIEQCSLKGKRVGGAMVSEKHAGFLINYDHATCADVRALISLIQETVYQQTGVYLEREMKILDARTLRFVSD